MNYKLNLSDPEKLNRIKAEELNYKKTNMIVCIIRQVCCFLQVVGEQYPW